MSHTIPALVLRTDGSHEDVELDVAPGGSTIHALYRAIGNGCMNVEVIDFPDLPGVATMWLDGEGLFNRPKRNELACALYAAYTGASPSDVVLVGDIVLTGGVDSEGDTVGLLPESRDFVLAQLGLAAA